MVLPAAQHISWWANVRCVFSPAVACCSWMRWNFWAANCWSAWAILPSQFLSTPQRVSEKPRRQRSQNCLSWTTEVRSVGGTEVVHGPLGQVFYKKAHIRHHEPYPRAMNGFYFCTDTAWWSQAFVLLCGLEIIHPKWLICLGSFKPPTNEYASLDDAIPWKLTDGSNGSC